MRTVSIMRGIQGSGKSYWANDNLCGPHIPKKKRAEKVSADDYFLDPKEAIRGREQIYRYDPAMLHLAHRDCLRRYLRYLQHDIFDIVVDNTNIRLTEIVPYHSLAELFDCQVEVIWVHAKPEDAVRRCIHDVPLDTIVKAAQSFDPLPPWYKVRHVLIPGGY